MNPFRWCAVALTATLFITHAVAQPSANAYPGTTPVRVVVPAPPGGPGDIVARALGQELSRTLGVPVVIDNKPGGASVPGALFVARSAADGHTLLLTLNTTHTQVPHMYEKPPFDPFGDFTPIAQIYRGYSILVAHPSLPAATMAEAVELSKRQTVSFGSPGPGTTGHLFIESLNHDHGAAFVHVPYKGSAPANQDLIGGHIQLLFDSPATSVPNVRSDRVKGLMVVGPRRLDALPDVPTAAEAGYGSLQGMSWMGLFGPADLDEGIVRRLNKAVADAVSSTSLREQFGALGVELVSTTPEAFADVIREDHARWGVLIRRIGIRLD